MKVLLIVGTVILSAILISIFIYSNPITLQVNKNAEKAKALKARADIKNIISLLDMFKLENNVYPTSDEGLKALIENPDPEKYSNWTQYLNKQRLDPWGNEYQYTNSDSKGIIDVYSLGPDGINSEENVRN